MTTANPAPAAPPKARPGRAGGDTYCRKARNSAGSKRCSVTVSWRPRCRGAFPALPRKKAGARASSTARCAPNRAGPTRNVTSAPASSARSLRGQRRRRHPAPRARARLLGPARPDPAAGSAHGLPPLRSAPLLPVQVPPELLGHRLLQALPLPRAPPAASCRGRSGAPRGGALPAPRHAPAGPAGAAAAAPGLSIDRRSLSRRNSESRHNGASRGRSQKSQP